FSRDWSSDVCSSDLGAGCELEVLAHPAVENEPAPEVARIDEAERIADLVEALLVEAFHRALLVLPVARRDARALEPQLEFLGIRSEERRVGEERRAG